MLKLHERFPNALLPAVLILLAIVASPAAASPWDRTLLIRVSDMDRHSPLSGVSVRLLPMDTLLVVRDGRAGCYFSSEYLPDTVLAIAAPDGFLPDTAKVHPRPGETTDVSFPMYRDVPRIAYGLLIDARTGRPVPGVTTTLLRWTVGDSLSLYERNPRLEVVRVDTTDAAGMYEIAVPPGTHTLDFVKPAYSYRSKEVHVEAGAAPVPKETRMYDTAFGRIDGKVVDARTGEAVAGCTFEVQGAPRAEADDPHGRYVIFGLESGEYRVTVSYLGYHPVQRMVVVRHGQTTREDFKLKQSFAEMRY